jgi:hypothetical protein
MKRTYGRVRDTETGAKTWVEVTTDANGHDDMVWLTTLVQVCKLNLGESPFYSDWGIPAHASVVTQIYPDFYVALTQQRFAPHFMSLFLYKVDDAFDDTGRPAPHYRFEAVTNAGAYLARAVPM